MVAPHATLSPNPTDVPLSLPCLPPCSYTFFKVAEEEYAEEEEAAAVPAAAAAALPAAAAAQ